MKFHVMHFSAFTFIMGNKLSCDVSSTLNKGFSA